MSENTPVSRSELATLLVAIEEFDEDIEENDSESEGSAEPIHPHNDGDAISSPPDAPSSIRDLLIDFYQRHNPDKLGDIDYILESYKGNESQLLDNLREKYKGKISETELWPNFTMPADLAPKIDGPPKSCDAIQRGGDTGLKADEKADSLEKSSNPTLMIGMQAAERFLVGWGLGNSQSAAQGPQANGGSVVGTKKGKPANLTPVDGSDATSKSPLERLQAEVAHLEAEKKSMVSTISRMKSQITSLNQINARLTTENNDISVRVESLQRNLVAVIDKEAHTQSDKQSLTEQVRQLERSRQDLKNKLSKAIRQKDNKHELLNETIALNHRLGAQVRFLAARTMELQQGDLACGSSGEIVSFDRCNTEIDEVLNRAIEKLSHTIGEKDIDKRMKPDSGTIEKSTADSSGAGISAMLRPARAAPGGEGIGPVVTVGSTQHDGINDTSTALSPQNGHSNSASVKTPALDSGVVAAQPAAAADAFRAGAAVGAAVGAMTVMSAGGTEGASNASNGVLSAKEGEEESDWPTVVRVLEARVAGLKASNVASRVELRLSMKQNGLLGQRVAEQQQVIDGLQKRLSNISHDLDSASGSADILRRQVTETSAELSRHKTLLQAADRRELERLSQMETIRREMLVLRESLSASEAARRDLASLFANHAKRSEGRALEYVNGLMERLLLEREDVTARLHAIYTLERDVRVAVSAEAQQEQQRLREELFRSRRSEAQKDREMSFLQRQLSESAGRIAALSQDVAEKEYLQRQLQDTKQQQQQLQQQLLLLQQQQSQQQYRSQGANSGKGSATR